MRRFIRSSTAMNLSHMIEKFVGTVEWIGITALASSDTAREVAPEMSLHVTLHFEVSVEQRVRMTDSAFQDLRWLAAWWDCIDGRTNNDDRRLEGCTATVAKISTGDSR
jgi:hypothetical protein